MYIWKSKNIFPSTVTYDDLSYHFKSANVGSGSDGLELSWTALLKSHFKVSATLWITLYFIWLWTLTQMVISDPAK